MAVFDDLGRALRWLRDQRRKKQYEVAEAAGITKGMLCAYETGKQRPSLDTLDKLLTALGCGLLELHDALALVNGRLAPLGAAAGQAPAAVSASGAGSGAYAHAGGGDELAEGAAAPLGEMVRGFHHLVRHLQEALQRLPAAPTEPAAPPPRAERESHRGR
jgi:transcriptional regulator with XRE-family HTH domain